MPAPEDHQNWPNRVFGEANALLIAANQAYLWGVRPDGQVLRLDTDDLGQRTEPEDDPRYVYAVLQSGARFLPELAELVPLQPEGVSPCRQCGGTGVPKDGGLGGRGVCVCGGLGWSI